MPFMDLIKKAIFEEETAGGAATCQASAWPVTARPLRCRLPLTSPWGRATTSFTPGWLSRRPLRRSGTGQDRSFCGAPGVGSSRIKL